VQKTTFSRAFEEFFRVDLGQTVHKKVLSIPEACRHVALTVQRSALPERFEIKGEL
jgi:hypothetical protein